MLHQIVLLRTGDYTDWPTWRVVLRRYDSASFQSRRLGELLIANLIEKRELSPDEAFDLLIGYLDDPDASEWQQLADLLAEHSELFDRFIEHAGLVCSEGAVRDGFFWTKSSRDRSIINATAMAWRLHDTYAEPCQAIVRAVFEAPLAPLRGDDESKAGSLDTASRSIGGRLAVVDALWEQLPEDHQAAFVGDRAAALVAVSDLDHPVARVLVAERDDSPPENDGYIADVIAAIDYMPEEFDGYGSDNWDFVIERLDALAGKAAAAIPRVTDLLAAYADAWDARVAEKLGELLMAMGLSTPPQVLLERAEKSRGGHNFRYLSEWTRKVPRERHAEMIAGLESGLCRLSQPSSWAPFIVATEAGLDVLAEWFDDDDRISGLVEAAQNDPPPAVRKVVVACAVRCISRRKNQRVAEVVSLLAPLADVLEPTESDHLFVARLGLVAANLDGADAKEIGSLSRERPSDPVALLLALRSADMRDGLEAAIAMLRERLDSLGEHDPVMRRAIADATGPEPRELYPLYGLTWRRFESKNYTGGVLHKVGAAFRKDPFYAMLCDDLGTGTPEDVAQRLELARAEYDTLLAMDGADEAALIALLSGDNWPLAMAAAQRLVAAGPTEPALAALVDTVAAVIDDGDKRGELCELLWREPRCREVLLGSLAVRDRIEDVTRGLPGAWADGVRTVAGALAELGHLDAVARLATETNHKVIMGVQRSILGPLMAGERYDLAAAVCESLAEPLTSKDPSFVLMQTNLAVVAIESGDALAAEQRLDALMETDFSHFDKSEAGEEDEFDGLLGGSLDKQVIAAFQQYWSMAHFNRACLYARTGRPDRAMDSLAIATAAGHYDAARIERESDLEPLRGRDDFAALLANLGDGQ